MADRTLGASASAHRFSWAGLAAAALLCSPLWAQCESDHAIAERLQTPRIKGGRNADPSQYPWISALLRFQAGDVRSCGELTSVPLGNLTCGGALIAPDWIVTAAHCLFDAHGDPVLPETLRILVGRTNLGRSGYKQGQCFGAKRVVPNPGYDPVSGELHNDIGLVQIESAAAEPVLELNRSEDRRPVCPGDPSRVAGWGTTGKETPTQLQEIGLNIASNRQCAEVWDQRGQSIIPSILCSGVYGGGTCPGDSGGPLVVRDINGVQLLAGVVSFGSSCNEEDYDDSLPTGFTRISSFVDWIQEVIDGDGLRTLLQFPFFASGAEFHSELEVFNPSRKEALRAEVSFWTSQGEPLPAKRILDLTGLEDQEAEVVDGVVAMTLAPSAKRLLRGLREGEIVAASARVDADRAVDGLIHYSHPLGASGSATSSRRLIESWIPVQRNEGLETSIAIRNTGILKIEVALTFFDEQGAERCQGTSIEIEGQGYKAGFVKEFLPADCGTVEGTVQLASQFNFAVVALQSKDGGTSLLRAFSVTPNR